MRLVTPITVQPRKSRFSDLRQEGTKNAEAPKSDTQVIPPQVGVG